MIDTITDRMDTLEQRIVELERRADTHSFIHWVLAVLVVLVCIFGELP